MSIYFDLIKEAKRGEGRGTGGPRQYDAGTNKCYCHDCDLSFKHKRGEPCRERKCPKCGKPLTGMSQKNND